MAANVNKTTDKDRARGRDKTPRGAGHGSGDRNEPGYVTGQPPRNPPTSEHPRGRAASGESYEDEADEILFGRLKEHGHGQEET